MGQYGNEIRQIFKDSDPKVGEAVARAVEASIEAMDNLNPAFEPDRVAAAVVRTIRDKASLLTNGAKEFGLASGNEKEKIRVRGDAVGELLVAMNQQGLNVEPGKRVYYGSNEWLRDKIVDAAFGIDRPADKYVQKIEQLDLNPALKEAMAKIVYNNKASADSAQIENDPGHGDAMVKTIAAAAPAIARAEVEFSREKSDLVKAFGRYQKSGGFISELPLYDVPPDNFEKDLKKTYDKLNAELEKDAKENGLKPEGNDRDLVLQVVDTALRLGYEYSTTHPSGLPPIAKDKASSVKK